MGAQMFQPWLQNDGRLCYYGYRLMAEAMRHDVKHDKRNDVVPLHRGFLGL